MRTDYIVYKQGSNKVNLAWYGKKCYKSKYLGGVMIDKADALVKKQLRSKISYYISPLWVKILLLILLLVAGGLNLHT